MTGIYAVCFVSCMKPLFDKMKHADYIEFTLYTSSHIILYLFYTFLLGLFLASRLAI